MHQVTPMCLVKLPVQLQMWGWRGYLELRSLLWAKECRTLAGLKFILRKRDGLQQHRIASILEGLQDLRVPPEENALGLQHS